MGDNDVCSFGDHVDDMTRGVLYQLDLLLGCVAQGIAAERDDDTRSVAFLLGHISLLNRNNSMRLALPKHLFMRHSSKMNAQ